MCLLFIVSPVLQEAGSSPIEKHALRYCVMGTSGKGASFEQYFFGHTARVTKIAVNPKNDTMLSAAQVCGRVCLAVLTVSCGTHLPMFIVHMREVMGSGLVGPSGEDGETLYYSFKGDMWTGAIILSGQPCTHHLSIVASITLLQADPPTHTPSTPPPSTTTNTNTHICCSASSAFSCRS